MVIIQKYNGAEFIRYSDGPSFCKALILMTFFFACLKSWYDYEKKKFFLL